MSGDQPTPADDLDEELDEGYVIDGDRVFIWQPDAEVSS